MSHGGKLWRETSSFPLSQILCGHRQIIFFAWLNHTQYLLIGKEFLGGKKAAIKPHLFHEAFPHYPNFKDFSIFKFILFDFSQTDKNVVLDVHPSF